MVNKDIFNQSLLDAINKEYENNITKTINTNITYENKK
jgi:hypothetical protein